MSKEVMMSMRMAPEAGNSMAEAHSSAPVGRTTDNNYSSNYKGVMLCDRPGIEVDRTAPQGGHVEPFLSAVNAPEQLGLNPIKKQHLHAGGEKKVKPNNSVLSAHKKWLHSLQQLKRELQAEEEAQKEEEEAQRAKLAAESQKVRDHIRQIKRQMTGIDDIQGPASARAVLSKQDMLSELKTKLNKEIVTELQDKLEETQKPPATAKSTKSADPRPAWARTAEQEEENHENEVEDLLAFAEELDIDQYMDDCEFREALAAAKARINELESDEECEEDDNRSQAVRSECSQSSVYSTMSAALRAKEAKEANGEKDWDGSVCSDSKHSRVSRLSRAVAEELLEMNPNLRRKHSARSLAEVVEKRGMIPENKQFDPQDQEKFGRCGVGAVKVAVHNEENRLHRHGEVTEGKDLPYLYRNPAV